MTSRRDGFSNSTKRCKNCGRPYLLFTFSLSHITVKFLLTHGGASLPEFSAGFFMNISKLIATCVGIGYLQKGAGTLAALFCCVLWYLLRIANASLLQQAVLIVCLFFGGVWVSADVEKEWGHDSNRIVVDEWLGMSAALFLVPFGWMNFAVAFVLFRFFDIAKPLFIRRMEKAPGGWGVMLDDLLAGVYSNLLLQGLIKSHLW